MATVRVARPAIADLRRIGQYTRRRWGVEQARRYLSELDSCFIRLAERPRLGRTADHIRPGLWRHGQGSHVVYYRRTDHGIRVIRVLHERMLPELHLLGDEGEDVK